jgi:hypothetical protein
MIKKTILCVLIVLMSLPLIPLVSAAVYYTSGQSDLRGSTVAYTGSGITVTTNSTTATAINFNSFNAANATFTWCQDNRLVYTANISAVNFMFTPGVPCTYWTVTRLDNGSVWLSTFYVTPASDILSFTGFTATWIIWVGALFYAIPLAINIGVYLYTKSIGLGVNAFLLTAAAGMYLDPALRTPSILVVGLGIVVLFYQLFIRRKT